MDINVRPKMGCVRATIGLTGQLDRPQPGNYFKPCQNDQENPTEGYQSEFII